MQGKWWNLLLKLCALVLSYTNGEKSSSMHLKNLEDMETLLKWIPDDYLANGARVERQETAYEKLWDTHASGQPKLVQLKNPLLPPTEDHKDKKDPLNLAINSWDPPGPNSNPYPEACPRKDLTETDYNNCVQHKNWEMFLRDVDKNDNFLANTRKILTTEYLNVFPVRHPKTHGKLVDCLVNDRHGTRPYPNQCYYLNSNSTTNDFKILYPFLDSIRGDLMYTFDFVLYNDKSYEVLQTQFWYLMKYLRFLATHIDNPVDIVHLNGYYNPNTDTNFNTNTFQETDNVNTFKPSSTPFNHQTLIEMAKRLDTIENLIQSRNKNYPKPIIINNHNNNTNRGEPIPISDENAQSSN